MLAGRFIFAQDEAKWYRTVYFRTGRPISPQGVVKWCGKEMKRAGFPKSVNFNVETQK